jgi:hypothetical protein
MRFGYMAAGVLLLFPVSVGTARADTCLCAGVAGNDDAIVFSFDDVATLSAIEQARKEVERPSEGSEHVLWCVGTDDPRCAPADPRSVPSGWFGKIGPTRPSARLPEVPSFDGQDVATLFDSVCVPTGIRHRVERPPRA